MNTDLHHAILGSLLGTAVGDAMGLSYEGMSRRRVAAFGAVRQRFLLGRGMFSDDTEHTVMLAQALLSSGDRADRLQQNLGLRLRWWLLALPAGVGLSTAKAILRLWLGFPSSRSGVRSAGNGAAMRSAILGVMYRNEPAKRRELAVAACRVTHTDERAIESACLVADSAAMAAQGNTTDVVLERLEAMLVSTEMKARFSSLTTSLAKGSSVHEYANEIGCDRGVSGFAPNTVAVAIYAWLRHREDFEGAVRSVIECGGDTDTVAAITGGICGAEVGESGIPRQWLESLCDWPISVHHLRQLARAINDGGPSVPTVFWPASLVRNLFFLAVVILHGFRRMLPPYHPKTP
jgi:ADP-ribosyl-[dinitrogen reductase] hydrolase